MPLSERTKHYVRSFIYDGDAFDHKKWLGQVRAEEAAKKEVGNVVDAEVREGNSPCAISSLLSRPIDSRTEGPHQGKSASSPGGAVREHKTTKALKRVSRAWGESQRCRKRDAIYRYLDRVFVLVKKYRQRGRISHLICKSQQFAGLPKNKQADVYTTVIRATTHDEIDHRAVSKYARALRYCRKHKGDQSLEAFIKSRSGINACAVLYARRNYNEVNKGGASANH